MSAPKKPERCAVCRRRPTPGWQCSHLRCPDRKPITAGPPPGGGDGPTPFRNPDNH